MLDKTGFHPPQTNWTKGTVKNQALILLTEDLGQASSFYNENVIATK